MNAKGVKPFTAETEGAVTGKGGSIGLSLQARMEGILHIVWPLLLVRLTIPTVLCSVVC